MSEPLPLDGAALLAQLRAWGRALGFSQIGVAGIDLALGRAAPGRLARQRFPRRDGLHGRARHEARASGRAGAGTRQRDHGAARLPAARRPRRLAGDRMAAPRPIRDAAAVSIYARGRDYHKVLRQRAAPARRSARRGDRAVRPSRLHRFGAGARGRARGAQRHRLARQAHPRARPRRRLDVLPRRDLRRPRRCPRRAPVERRTAAAARACIDVCPTRAIVAPYELDARRCISYLTIELKGAIPVEFRAAIGNRIYGCDDCQLVCPWNKFASASPLADFDVRPALDAPPLLALWAWSEDEFLRAHRRQRDPAHRLRALAAQPRGRARQRACARAAMRRSPPHCVARRDEASALVREHIDWALAQAAGAAGPGLQPRLLGGLDSTATGDAIDACIADTVDSPATIAAGARRRVRSRCLGPSRPIRTSRCAWSCRSRPAARPTSSPASSPRRSAPRSARR